MHSIYAANIVIDLIERSDHRHDSTQPRRPVAKHRRVAGAVGKFRKIL